MHITKPFFLGALKFLCFVPLALSAQSPSMLIERTGDSPPEFRVLWKADPGIRYELQKSDDLLDWLTLPGFPALATQLAGQHPIIANENRQFFRVVPLDEQPPEIVEQFPSDDAFAVRRFANFIITLNDASGIDPDSIALTIGANEPLTVSSPGVTFTDNTLVYDSGDAALGVYGETITASLTVADTLGHALNHTWTFDLEVEAQVVENLFVFGSPQAQQSGQKVDPTKPTAALADRHAGGPIRLNAGADPWSISEVREDRIILAYADTAPAFAPGTYLSNLTPAHADEIFYRKVISIDDDPAAKQLTLMTEDVPLAEIVEHGSASLSSESVIYQFDGNSAILAAFSFENTITFGSIGHDLSGTKLYDAGGVTLTMQEAYWWFTPSLSVSFETRLARLERFSAQARGELRVACVPKLEITSLDLTRTVDADIFTKKHLIFLGTIGIVPIWLDVTFNLNAEIGFNLNASAELLAGIRQEMDLSFGVSYAQGASPATTWTRSASQPAPQIVPFDYTISGSGNAWAKLTPQVDIRVNSLAGVYANVEPRIEATGSATISNGELTDAEWTLGAYADLNAGLSVIFVDSGSLPGLSYPLFAYEWSDVYPKPAQISFRRQPQGISVPQGDSAVLNVDVVADAPLKYQWYHKGDPIPGETGTMLRLTRIGLQHGGEYYVRASAGANSLNSSIATVTILPTEPVGPAPSGMALISAGAFVMGDSFNDSDASWGERPVHTVYVSAFYMDRTPVTKALWDEVYQWAIANGYTFENPGLGKAANHPVCWVDWYDVVKWCNARSEKEGRVPAYYTSAAQTTVYRTGQEDMQNDWVKWNSGYRLPTEAEWEKAARGGASGQRFPWGNTITHSQANYLSSSSYSYDVSPTREFHPTFNDGINTSPVGYFEPNGYGLYDMAGNVVEWCWDWWSSSYYASSPGADPRGPVTGTGSFPSRVIRGGSRYGTAITCRSAWRGGQIPRHHLDANNGFRSVLPPGQP